jgi:OFA family oxalate/formate antiporter-like MFS transporter
LQTWCSPLQAYLVDKFGPRLLISAGALMAGAGWVLSAYVENIWALYLTYGVICGFGTGIIYVGIIGLMVRWFPDRRGLATGLAAAGYGFGAIFTSFPIDSMIKSAGYAHTLVVWGIIQGAIGIIAAQWLRIPPEGWQPDGYAQAAPARMQSKRSWRRDYNNVRPHSRIGWLAPAVYAANLSPQSGQGAALAEGSAPWPIAPTVQDGNRQTLSATG